VGWLAGTVDGVVADDEVVGVGDAAPLQAPKTIATTPIMASGDHLLGRDMR
jgi:hypothetical protein